MIIYLINEIKTHYRSFMNDFFSHRDSSHLGTDELAMGKAIDALSIAFKLNMVCSILKDEFRHTQCS